MSEYKKTIAGPYGSEEVDMTPDEIEVRQAEESAPAPLAPLKDRLKAILFGLSDDIQAQFVTLSAAVESALDNHAVNVAKIAIENADIPVELEPVRQSMLEEFERA